MTEREQHSLAWRLAEDSPVFDFDAALKVVRNSPDEAERLLREEEEWRVLMDELKHANEQLREAAREFR